MSGSLPTWGDSVPKITNYHIHRGPLWLKSIGKLRGCCCYVFMRSSFASHGIRRYVVFLCFKACDDSQLVLGEAKRGTWDPLKMSRRSGAKYYYRFKAFARDTENGIASMSLDIWNQFEPWGSSSRYFCCSCCDAPIPLHGLSFASPLEAVRHTSCCFSFISSRTRYTTNANLLFFHTFTFLKPQSLRNTGTEVRNLPLQSRWSPGETRLLAEREN